MEYRALGGTGITVSTHCLGAMMFGAWGNAGPRRVRADHPPGARRRHQLRRHRGRLLRRVSPRRSWARRSRAGATTSCWRPRCTARWGPGSISAATRGCGSRARSRTRCAAWTPTTSTCIRSTGRTDGRTSRRRSGRSPTCSAQGKIRAFGCSTFPGWQIVESHWVAERRGLSRFRTEQPPYSIFARAIELDVLPVAQRYGMGVLSWSPLGRGWLTGRYRRGSLRSLPRVPRGAQPRARRRLRGAVRRGAARRSNASSTWWSRWPQIADGAGISMTHMAIAFTLAHPAITSTIIGPRTEEQLDDLLKGADVRVERRRAGRHRRRGAARHQRGRQRSRLRSLVAGAGVPASLTFSPVTLTFSVASV